MGFIVAGIVLIVLAVILAIFLMRKQFRAMMSFDFGAFIKNMPQFMLIGLFAIVGFILVGVGIFK